LSNPSEQDFDGGRIAVRSERVDVLRERVAHHLADFVGGQAAVARERKLSNCVLDLEVVGGEALARKCMQRVVNWSHGVSFVPCGGE